tara:strand:+ start:7146 stop:7577 length:432 start_codon:yes stop_codon:yes gene_type:complete
MKKNQILLAFLKFYNFNSDKIDLQNKKEEEIIESVSNSIVLNINSGKDTPVSIAKLMFVQCFKELDKITIIDDTTYQIDPDNMPRNFKDEEMKFFTKSVDMLMEFIQNCVVKSNKTEKEEDDWDNSMLEFGKKFFSSKGVRFE